MKESKIKPIEPSLARFRGIDKETGNMVYGRGAFHNGETVLITDSNNAIAIIPETFGQMLLQKEGEEGGGWYNGDIIVFNQEQFGGTSSVYRQAKLLSLGNISFAKDDAKRYLKVSNYYYHPELYQRGINLTDYNYFIVLTEEDIEKYRTELEEKRLYLYGGI